MKEKAESWWRLKNAPHLPCIIEREREKRVYGEKEKVARVQKETVHFVTDVSPAGHLSVSSGNVIMI